MNLMEYNSKGGRGAQIRNGRNPAGPDTLRRPGGTRRLKRKEASQGTGHKTKKKPSEPPAIIFEEYIIVNNLKGDPSFFAGFMQHSRNPRYLYTFRLPPRKKRASPAGTLLEELEMGREGGYFTTRVPFFDQCLKDQNLVHRKSNTPLSVATSSTVTDSFFRKCSLMPNSFILIA